MDTIQPADPEHTTQQRLAALARYGIMDTEPEAGFDDIVLLATRLCDTPVALVSLVAADRQWFKARIGFPGCETPLAQSICAHALREDGILIIPDLTHDARTRNNALVTGEPFIRFYAGAVLVTGDGVPIGTLCVIDTVPRPQGLTPIQADSLQALARQVVGQMELQRLILEREGALLNASDADAQFKQHQNILRDERQHRLKNVVALVQSIVLQSLRHSENLENARAAISARLRALVKGQEVLFLETSENTCLSAIVGSIADLYQSETNNFDIDGPKLDVSAKAALAFSLILNELATNATKYGALSSVEGIVTIRWVVEASDQEMLLRLSWNESRGPAVIFPKRRGFGTTLIEQALTGSKTKADYLPSGLVFTIEVPLSRL